MKKIIVIITAFLVLVLIVLLLIKSDKDVPVDDKNNNEFSYIEIVKEDPTCSENCFLEYIILSNGTVLKKYIKSFTDKSKNGLSLSKSGDDLSYLFKRANEITGKYGNNNGIECDKCVIYHLYRNEGETLSSYSSKSDETPEEIKDIMDEIGGVYENSIPGKDIFVHFYFERKDYEFIDYHIFTDGDVIREVFGRKNGELLESDTYRITAKQRSEIKNLIGKEFFLENTANISCLGKNILWGYLEIKKYDDYNYVYTCADGKLNSDIIFNYLMYNIDK